MNRLITFEGIDGSGKTTQIRMLCERLYKFGIQYEVVREPGGTRISEMIRDILLNKDHLELFPVSESLLFLAARAQLVSEVILPTLKLGKFVICDRYTDSTMCYQGHGRGLDRDSLNTLNNYATQFTEPALTFILDINLQTSLSRREVMEKDRMESGGIEFLNRVREGYLEISKTDRERYHVIDGTRPPEPQFEEIWNIITNKFVDIRSQF